MRIKFNQALMYMIFYWDDVDLGGLSDRSEFYDSSYQDYKQSWDGEEYDIPKS